MRIIICGGRHFDDYEYLKVSCDSVISQTGTDKEIEIVSGHCEGWDCCGVLALYYRDGRYREGAVKHTDMWLKLFPELPLSPLYRLRKFNGKLTGNDAVYEEISKIINGDNATGDKIWELTYRGTIETPEELLEKIKEIL